MDRLPNDSGGGNQGYLRSGFDFLRNTFATRGDRAQQNIERQKHEGMHKRISALLGMDNNEQKQYLWRLIKNDESNDIAKYMTPEIQEALRKKRGAIDDEEAKMIDENVLPSVIGPRLNELALEYDQEEMLLVLGEINRRINQ